MTNTKENHQVLIHPKVKKFTDNLAKLLSHQDTVEFFESGTPEQILETVLLASVSSLEVKGNFILLNADLPFKDLIQFN